MDFTPLAERFGEQPLAALGALVIGMGFGAFAQKSRFCLRAATVDFSRGRVSARVAVWLLVFSTALFFTQLLGFFSLAPLEEARKTVFAEQVARYDALWSNLAPPVAETVAVPDFFRQYDSSDTSE